jgi:rubrerythrin
MFSIQDIIDVAIQIEENGEQFFRNAMQKTKDPALISLLQWLADEETEHIRWFKTLKRTVQQSVEISELEKMGRALLREAVGDQRFALGDTDFSKIKQVEALLALAIKFEKDTVLFYQMLQPFMEDRETVDQLKKIVEEEERHAQKLQDFLDGDRL